MPAPSWERADDFLRGDEFALQVQIWRGGALLRTIKAIFDEPSVDARLGDNMGERRGLRSFDFETTTPTILGTDASLAGVVRGDEVRLDGRIFDVMASPAPDGTGWARLRIAPQFGQGGR